MGTVKDWRPNFFKYIYVHFTVDVHVHPSVCICWITTKLQVQSSQRIFAVFIARFYSRKKIKRLSSSSSSFSYKIHKVVTASNIKFNVEIFIKAYQDLCDGIDLLNSIFTFQLVPVLINAIASKTFTAYGLLVEATNPSPFLLMIFLQNGFWMGTMYLLEFIMAFAGSSVTKAAQETLVVMTKILNNSSLDEDFALPMQHFVSRVNCRNLKVQNCFFKIDWIILLQVRLLYKK